MKITEDVRKYVAAQGIAEEEALKQGMEERSKEFVEKGGRFTRRRDFVGARLCRRPAAATSEYQAVWNFLARPSIRSCCG